MPASRWPKFTWDANARQYRGADGKFVPRVVVRQALDETIESAKSDITRASKQLQAGQVSLIEWQLRLEKSIKTIHVMSTAIAAGGWAQATSADWSLAGNRIKDQYAWLERFARQIEDGLPLDGRFLNRAESYARSGSGTYEKALRRIDVASGLVTAERRVLHSGHPCSSCYAYHAAGWQSPGILPDVGEECDCGSRCQCSFERRFAKASRKAG